MKINEFLNNVREQIKYKPIRTEIVKELESHIEEKKETYIHYGLSNEEAEEKAVLQMGVAEDIGKSLNKIHKPRFDWKVLITVSILLVFGLLVAYTRDNLFYKEIENNMVGITYSREFGAKFIEYFAWIGVSMVCLVAVHFIDYRRLSKYSLCIYLVALVVTFACISKENATVIDVTVPPLYIMQAFLMPLYIIAFAGFMQDLDKESKIKIDNITNRNVNIIKAIVLSAISILLVLQIPSVLCAVVLGIAYAVMASSRLILELKSREKIMKILNTVFIVLGLFITTLTICTLINYKLDGGILTGNFSNLGTNDAFMLIFTNYGLIASIIAILCISVFSVCLAVSVSKIKDLYGKILSIGISSMFLMQIVFSILSNIRLGFEWGVEMPFLSFGITNLVVNMICLGLVLSVYRRKDILLKVEG